MTTEILLKIVKFSMVFFYLSIFNKENNNKYKKVYVETVKQIVESEERNHENTRWLYANILSYGDSGR